MLFENSVLSKMYRRKSFGAISLVLLALMLLTIDLVVKKLFDHFQFKIRACCTAFFVVLFSNWWFSIWDRVPVSA